ncbi:glycosyltransferase family 2 protein [Ramlibacter sp. WS9]|uniref:glycosyltransferase family 2 protein n=1 Tax=Ramlibacter sp. WS9 TaxID=1882741 RepID=UPI00114170FF|nr:glycosyltransferase [Ramlibacter sp. WS9]ROZ79409.1 glycosyltransferase [Ramlibacter sp. WS9]
MLEQVRIPQYRCRQEARPLVSFCITCKDRLIHLRETLARNLAWHEGDPDVEFVIVNYNSGDELQEWIKDKYGPDLESGRVVHFFNPEPAVFRASHAKNQAFRLARGAILCNLDADNFTGPGFAAYVRRQLQTLDFLSGGTIVNDRIIATNVRGVEGRNVVPRELFWALGGFDEHFSNWGYEDSNLSERMMALGLAGRLIDDEYLSCIDHGDELRTRYFSNKVTGRNTGRAFGSCKDNYEIWLEKKACGHVVCAPDKFGCGTVHRNFAREPLVLGPRS